MSKTGKWIIGIVVVLVVLSAFGFLAWNAYHFTHWSGRMRAYERYHPDMREEFEGFEREEWDTPRVPHDRWYESRIGGYKRVHGPMGGYGFMPLPLLVFGGLFRMLVPLGVLALVAYVAYQEGKKTGMKAALEAPPTAPETKKTKRKGASAK
jgi:hypothetical protein